MKLTKNANERYRNLNASITVPYATNIQINIFV